MFNKFDDNYELFRLSLQFFGDGDGEPEDTPPVYVSDGSGGKKDKSEILAANGISGSREEYDKKVGALGEQDFYDKYGLDPDRDYLSQKKELEYNYMTEMATYGEKAERLYQMGLSNSGVSDIFQANAYSAYLSNVNTAAAERIEAKRKNALAYQEYQQGITDGWLEEERLGNQTYSKYESEYDTTLNANSTQAYNLVIDRWMFTGAKDASGNYTEYNSISNFLKSQGYDSATIDAVWKKLSTTDTTWLTNSRVAESAKLIDMTTFNGSEEQKAHYQNIFNTNGFGDVFEQAWASALSLYNTSPAGIEAATSTYVETYSGTYTLKDADGNEVTYTGYDPDQEEAIRAAMASAGASQSVIDSTIKKLKSTFEEKVTAGATNTRARMIYNGSNRTDVENMLKAEGYTAAQAREIVDKLEELRKADANGFTNERVLAGYNTYHTYYTGADSETQLRSMLADDPANFTAEEIESIVTEIKTMYDLSPAGIEAATSQYVDTYSGTYELNGKTYTGYDPDNEQAIRAAMAAAGASQGVIDKVIKELDRQYAEHEDFIDDGYKMAYEIYDGENWTDVSNMLDLAGYDDNDISEIFEMFSGIDTTALPASVKKTEERAQNVRNGVALLLKDSLNVNKTDDQLKALLVNAGMNEDEAAQSVTNFREMDLSALSNQNVADALAMIDMKYYNGSEAHKTFYRGMLENANFSDADIAAAFDLADDAIAADNPSDATEWNSWLEENGYLEDYNGTATSAEKLRKILQNNNCSEDLIESVLSTVKTNYSDSIKLELNDDISEITNLSTSAPQNLTFGNFTERMQVYKSHLNSGVITQKEYDDYLAQLQSAAENTVSWILEDLDNLDRAYGVLGFDVDAWADMDDGERYIAALNAVGTYHGDGLISDYTKKGVFDSWEESERTSIVEELKETSGIESWQSLGYDGLMEKLDQNEILGAYITQLSDFAKKGYLEDSDVEIYIKRILSRAFPGYDVMPFGKVEPQIKGEDLLRASQEQAFNNPPHSIDFSDPMSIINWIGEALRKAVAGS